ncbi:hypothetical protein VNO77_27208 [Canavalia gladiata]|uniref:Uncharacterized protein n=1 Tax=Canavalia gladiata TaxID=3824 RepID=A0AAN9QAA6_CANGL
MRLSSSMVKLWVLNEAFMNPLRYGSIAIPIKRLKPHSLGLTSCHVVGSVRWKALTYNSYGQETNRRNKAKNNAHEVCFTPVEFNVVLHHISWSISIKGLHIGEAFHARLALAKRVSAMSLRHGSISGVRPMTR